MKKSCNEDLLFPNTYRYEPAIRLVACARITAVDLRLVDKRTRHDL